MKNVNTKRRYSRSLETSDGVDALLSTLSRNPKVISKLKNYKEFSNWSEIVGEDLAQMSKPIKVVKNRVLVIKVASTTLAQELSLRKDNIIDYFNQLDKGFSIEDVRFVCSNPSDFLNELNS